MPIPLDDVTFNGGRRTKAYSMYGVVVARFSSEGRRRRDPSTTLPTAGEAIMFANNEETGQKLRGCDKELSCLSKRPELHGVQKRFIS